MKITLLIVLGALVVGLLGLNLVIADEHTPAAAHVSLEDAVKVDKAMMYDEGVDPGDLAELRVNIENIDGDLDEVKISAVIPELGVRTATTNFDLSDSRDEGRTLVLEIPEWAEPGVYAVRIQISSDEGRHRILHREVVVG